jgi:serine 3-dehydrogenase
MNEQVFLITGASTGIGAATARRAFASGYRLVLVARDLARLTELSSSLGEPERVMPLACDVRDWDGQGQMLDQALARFGRLDVVFANAGQFDTGCFLGDGTNQDAWHSMVLTNVFGLAATIRLTLPSLVDTAGHLVLTGSVVGAKATIPAGLYPATKAAVAAIGATVRAELRSTGVRVTMVEPGMVDTPLWPRRPEAPLLDPDDVARAVLWAVQQPAHVDVNEILLRPIGQAI